MGRSKNGEAVGVRGRTPEAVQALTNFLAEATAKGDLATWRRAKAVLGYIQGKRAKALSLELDVTRGSINRWLQWYDVSGVDGLRTRPIPGAAPRLSGAQRAELSAVIEAGPQAAGFTSGMWTGPMVGDWILEHFGVSYHSHHIPRLLHQLGFSVQRPRKRLARADAEAQAAWLKERLPEIKKKRQRPAASSYSKTRPASGSTGLSTRPGPKSASSRE